MLATLSVVVFAVLWGFLVALAALGIRAQRRLRDARNQGRYQQGL